MLERDPDNKDLISIPETALQGAITSIRLHYELDASEDVPELDVEEAVVSRFKRRVGIDTTDVEWVTIDTSKQTKLETAIKEKTARHGLEDANVLAIELEINNREHLKQCGLYQEPEDQIKFDAKRFLKTFESIWNKVIAAEKKREKTEGSKWAESLANWVGRRGGGKGWSLCGTDAGGIGGTMVLYPES